MTDSTPEVTLVEILVPTGDLCTNATLKYVFKYRTKVDEIIEDPDFLYVLTDRDRLVTGASIGGGL